MNIKKLWKKFWFIVWEDPSLKGWLISILFLFVMIKLVFLPMLSLVTGTPLPLAIVESCSMYHKADLFSDFDSWWQKHETKYTSLEITKSEFENYAFTRGFNKGDILFMMKAPPEKIKIGDVILFDANQKNPVIHRVINIKHEDEKYIFSTLGDNNNGQLSIEKEISEDKLVGKAVFKIVLFAGWGKLIFFENSRPASERGLCGEN